MSDLMQQGLWISVVGFGLLFVFMGLITLMMILLERLTRDGTQPSAQDGPTSQERTVVRGSENEEVVAAISVAVAYLRDQDRGWSNLGATLETGHGPWWLTGRSHQNLSRPARTSRRRG